MIVESFVWPKVDRRGDDECWPWLGGRNKRGGHGVAYIGNGRSIAAHRAVFVLLRGPIPDGLVTDHLCRNPSCVNPSHIEPVTQAENVRRGRVSEANALRKGWTYPNRRRRDNVLVDVAPLGAG